MALITVPDFQYYIRDGSTDATFLAFLQLIIDTQTDRISSYLGWDVNTPGAFFFTTEGTNKRDLALPMAASGVGFIIVNERQLVPGALPVPFALNTDFFLVNKSILRSYSFIWKRNYEYSISFVPSFYYTNAVTTTNTLLRSCLLELCSLFLDASKRGYGNLSNETDYNTVFESSKLKIDRNVQNAILQKLVALKTGSVIM